MDLTLAEALDLGPLPEAPDGGQEMLARAIDAVLGLARDQPVLMRAHMAGIVQQEGFVQCDEQQRVAFLLRAAMVRYGSPDPGSDYPLLRANLMGSVFAALLPGAPMPLEQLRGELFARYGLKWERGVPRDEADRSMSQTTPAECVRRLQRLRPCGWEVGPGQRGAREQRT